MSKNPDHYAIVIGIDGYVQLLRLRASGSDATRFARWLTSCDGGGLPDSNVQLIVSPPKLPLDPLDAEPGERHIRRALRDLGVENNKKIGQRLYFYFAGHGFGPTFDDIGMLLADAAMTQLGSNIGLRPYRLFFHSTLLFDEVIFILDCCRDPIGSITNGPFFTLGNNGQFVKVNDCVVMAAAYGEKAFQPLDKETNERRGLLTDAVLEGLGGAAADARGRVTAVTLSEYVRRRVPKLVVEKVADPKLGQTPAFDPSSEEIILTTVTADKLPKVRVRIVAPAGLAGDLVLRDGTDRSEIERRPAVQVTKDQPPWEKELLRNSRYEVQHTESLLSMLLDPSNTKEKQQVYRFPQPQ